MCEGEDSSVVLMSCLKLRLEGLKPADFFDWLRRELSLSRLIGRKWTFYSIFS